MKSKKIARFPKSPGKEYPGQKIAPKETILASNYLSVIEQLKHEILKTVFKEFFIAFGFDVADYGNSLKDYQKLQKQPDLIILTKQKLLFVKIIFNSSNEFDHNYLKNSQKNLESNRFIYILCSKTNISFRLLAQYDSGKNKLYEIFENLEIYANEINYFLDLCSQYISFLSQNTVKEINYDDEFIYRKLRGKLVETIFIETFTVLGYSVQESGQEAFLHPMLLGKLHNFLGENALIVRKTPDLIIEKENECFFCEVKHSPTGKWSIESMGEYPEYESNVFVLFAGAQGLKAIDIKKLKRGEQISPNCTNFLYKMNQDLENHRKEIAFISNQVLTYLPYLTNKYEHQTNKKN